MKTSDNAQPHSIAPQVRLPEGVSKVATPGAIAKVPADAKTGTIAYAPTEVGASVKAQTNADFPFPKFALIQEFVTAFVASRGFGLLPEDAKNARQALQRAIPNPHPAGRGEAKVETNTGFARPKVSDWKAFVDMLVGVIVDSNEVALTDPVYQHPREIDAFTVEGILAGDFSTPTEPNNCPQEIQLRRLAQLQSRPQRLDIAQAYRAIEAATIAERVRRLAQRPDEARRALPSLEQQKYGAEQVLQELRQQRNSLAQELANAQAAREPHQPDLDTTIDSLVPQGIDPLTHFQGLLGNPQYEAYHAAIQTAIERLKGESGDDKLSALASQIRKADTEIEANTRTSQALAARIGRIKNNNFTRIEAYKNGLIQRLAGTLAAGRHRELLANCTDDLAFEVATAHLPADQTKSLKSLPHSQLKGIVGSKAVLQEIAQESFRFFPNRLYGLLHPPEAARNVDPDLTTLEAVFVSYREFIEEQHAATVAESKIGDWKSFIDDVDQSVKDAREGPSDLEELRQSARETAEALFKLISSSPELGPTLKIDRLERSRGTITFSATPTQDEALKIVAKYMEHFPARERFESWALGEGQQGTSERERLEQFAKARKVATQPLQGPHVNATAVRQEVKELGSRVDILRNKISAGDAVAVVAFLNELNLKSYSPEAPRLLSAPPQQDDYRRYHRSQDTSLTPALYADTDLSLVALKTKVQQAAQEMDQPKQAALLRLRTDMPVAYLEAQIDRLRQNHRGVDMLRTKLESNKTQAQAALYALREMSGDKLVQETAGPRLLEMWTKLQSINFTPIKGDMAAAINQDLPQRQLAALDGELMVRLYRGFTSHKGRDTKVSVYQSPNVRGVFDDRTRWSRAVLSEASKLQASHTSKTDARGNLGIAAFRRRKLLTAEIEAIEGKLEAASTQIREAREWLKVLAESARRPARTDEDLLGEDLPQAAGQLIKEAEARTQARLDDPADQAFVERTEGWVDGGTLSSFMNELVAGLDKVSNSEMDPASEEVLRRHEELQNQLEKAERAKMANRRS